MVGVCLSSICLPDAVVAFVDGELSSTAHERASAHIQRCGFCAFETFTQQQARSAVRTAVDAHGVGLAAGQARRHPAGGRAAVRSGRARDHRGRSVRRRAARRTSPRSAPGRCWARRDRSAASGWFSGRRARQGAGVVVCGMVLGALAFTTPDSDERRRPAADAALARRTPAPMLRRPPPDSHFTARAGRLWVMQLLAENSGRDEPAVAQRPDVHTRFRSGRRSASQAPATAPGAAAGRPRVRHRLRPPGRCRRARSPRATCRVSAAPVRAAAARVARHGVRPARAPGAAAAPAGSPSARPGPGHRSGVLGRQARAATRGATRPPAP